MSETNILATVALVMSAMSLMLSSASVWPSWKDHLASIRDAILWIALVFVIVGAANYAWRSSQLRGQSREMPAKQQAWSSRPIAGSPECDSLVLNAGPRR